MKECNPIYSSTPKVDNSPEECDGEFKATDCVVATERDVFLRIREGDTLTEIINKISEELESQRRLINKLK